MIENIRRRISRQITLLVFLVTATALVAQAKLPAKANGDDSRPRPVARLASERPRIEVAFVLDTTGSMTGLIEGAKRKIWSVASAMADGQPTPDIRIGLIGYRDRGDDYVTRTFDLTSDIDSIYGHLQAFRAGGGGDTPESVNQALHEAVTRLSWSPGDAVYKVVFLVGDAPPHMDYANDVEYPETLKFARKRHIIINTIQCGSQGDTAQIWQQIARGGSGQYVAIRQDGAMVAMETPMDEELAHLNRELAETVVAYGSEMDKTEIERKVAWSRAAAPSVAASRLSYLAKNGGRVNSGRSDLVDAVKEGRIDTDAIDTEALPDEMKAMDAAERRNYVQQKLDAREKIQARISDLSARRDAYLKRETERLIASGEGDGFDQQVLGAIRLQAAAVGIRYE